MLRTHPVIHSIKSSFPWNRRAISRSASYLPPDKRNWVQSVGSKTIGEVIGGSLFALSLVDLGYNLIYKRGEDSIFKKLLTPILGTILGSISIGISRLPKDAFSADLIRNGITSVLNKLKSLSKKAINLEEISSFFSDEDKNTLKEKVESLILAAWPQIQASLPDSTFENSIVSSLRSIHPENVTLEGLRELFKEHGEDALSTFIETNPVAFRKTLEELFNKENKPFQERFKNLICTVNDLVQPSGLALDLIYNTSNNLMEIYLISSDLYSHKSKRELYNPFFVISAKPSYIFTALEHLQKRLKNMEILREQAIESLERTEGNMTDETSEIFQALKENLQTAVTEVFISLSSGLFDMVGRTRAGYFVIDKGTKERLETIYINKTIDELISNGYIPLGEMKKDIEEIQAGPETIKVKRDFVASRERERILEAEDEEAYSGVLADGNVLIEDDKVHVKTNDPFHSGFSGPASPELHTSIPISRENQTSGTNGLQYILNLLSISFPLKEDETPSLQDNATRLKICLVKACLLSHLEKRSSEPQNDPLFKGIMYKIGEFVSDYNFTDKNKDEMVRVESKGNGKYKIPEDLLSINLFLKALGFQNISRQDPRLNTKLQKLQTLFSLLDESQADKLKAKLDESLYPKVIPTRKS